MSQPKNPLGRLSRQELLWLAGILKDACRERLEKNLVSQALESRLYERGPVEGRVDPRPFLRIWEPRYRKFLEVATELHTMLEADQARALVRSLRVPGGARRRHAMIEENGSGPRRKPGS